MDTSDLDKRRNAYRGDLAAESLRGKVAAPRYAAGEARRVAEAQCRCAAHPTHTRAGRLRRCSASSSPSTTSMRDGPGCSSPATAMSAICRPRHWRPRPQTRRIGWRRSARRSIRRPTSSPRPRWRSASMRRFAWQRPGPRSPGLRMAVSCPRRTSPSTTASRPTSSGSPKPSSACPTCGAARPGSGWIAPGCCRSPCRPPAWPVHATATCSRRSWAPRSRLSGELDGLARGDLVFWAGHVGIMLDAVRLLHANAHHMAVAAEPLRVAADRIAGGGSVITAIKRLAPR